LQHPIGEEEKGDVKELKREERRKKSSLLSAKNGFLKKRGD